MRWFTLASTLLAVPLQAMASQHDDQGRAEAPAVVDRADVAEQLAKVDALVSDALRAQSKKAAASALKRARQQLDAVREQVDVAPSPREWLRAQREANRWSDAPEAEARRPVPVGALGVPVAGAIPAPRPPPPAPEPMSDASLAQLLATVDQQPSSVGRLGVIQQAAPGSYFLVRQVQILVGRLAYAPDQVQAARLLQPRVLDRENEHHLNAWLRAPHAALVERQSFEARSSVTLQPGVYRGSFRVAGSNLKVVGAGRDQTVIDGNLVVSHAFNTVSGLTVLGRVVIEGSQNHLRDVDYRGGIDDRGLLNKY
ncbi:MAG TPA: DUF4476 domain-containing protein [Anaeromyxobacteraceae bacterium]|nr:DUF4476 domain-containing protein [Anaeromyxobacteraceae bacterium]